MTAAPALFDTTSPRLSLDRDPWLERILDSFADRNRTGGFLPIAGEAERVHPGNPVILCLAATAALFDGEPDRARVYLKRYSKRCTPSRAYWLLSGLTLAQEGRRELARQLLEAHRLEDLGEAIEHFPGGWPKLEWLRKRYIEIFRGSRTPPAPKKRPTPKTASPKPVFAAKRPAAVRSEPREPKIAPLAKIALDVPVTFDIDMSPLADALRSPPPSDDRWFGLRERLAHLSLAREFDELLCLPHVRGIEPFWYQTETVRKVLKQFRGRVLLADEVGLGKTVEAGLALKEYLLRGMAERALVLVPPSLVGQWREELETKFAIAAATTQDALLRNDPERFWDQPLIVASLALARRAEHAHRLKSRAFDLVIVDEAHHLRDRSSQSWQLVDGLNKRFLLLLSATPVQNDLVELYNLLTLLKPGIFKTLREFKSGYMMGGKGRLPANPDRLRELMRTVMIRNTRAVVALKLPRRHAATLCVEASAAEAAAYRALSDAVRAAATASGAERLALAHLLGAAGSSPAAAATALLRHSARHAKEQPWSALAVQWQAIESSGKEAQLIELLKRNPQEKTLVFVHYRATLDRLAHLLDAAGIAHARFDGSMTGAEKDAAIAAFREQVNVLLCTESGGEGRNIQFCNTLVNFDVPWNPMTIEQRIGRIDRIGQQREVFIFNLATKGSIEEEILKLLDEKIAMFELVVGEAGAILGHIEEGDGEFANMVLQAWLEPAETQRHEALDGLGRKLVEARSRHDNAKAFDEQLFGQEFDVA